METPSKSSGPSRVPLCSLDTNSHLLSPHSASHESTVLHKMFSTAKTPPAFITPGRSLYSLKDNMTPSALKQAAYATQPTPVRSLYGETPSKSIEKRKEAPMSAYRDVEDAERAVKQARLAHERRDSGHGRSLAPSTSEYKPAHSRQSSASGHGHKLFGEIATRVETVENIESSQGTIVNGSFNDGDMADGSQLTTVSAPDVEGPPPATRQTPSPENLRANAQALKLRLQFAMYKLQTHQEHVPLQHVRVMPTNQRFPVAISSPTTNRGHASRPASPVRPSSSPQHEQQYELRREPKDVGSGMRHLRTPSDPRGGKEIGNYVSKSGHSRTPSGGSIQRSQRVSPAGELQAPYSSQFIVRRPSLPVDDDTEEEEEEDREGRQRGVRRDTVSPSLDQRRDNIATPTFAERQDGLLSLANAVEHASSQERQEREKSN